MWLAPEPIVDWSDRVSARILLISLALWVSIAPAVSVPLCAAGLFEPLARGHTHGPGVEGSARVADHDHSGHDHWDSSEPLSGDGDHPSCCSPTDLDAWRAEAPAARAGQVVGLRVSADIQPAVPQQVKVFSRSPLPGLQDSPYLRENPPLLI